MADPAPVVWHLLTGEYPPLPGGIADHTAVVAAALAEQGRQVHVWCPPLPGSPPNVNRVTVHPLTGGFRPAGLRNLGRRLDTFPRPRTLLVQYVHTAFGLCGLNLPSGLWLLARRRISSDDIRVIVHEPYFPFGRQSLPRNLLAAGTHALTAAVLAAARRVYVPTAGWEPLLRRVWPFAPRPTWLPVPATVPGLPDGADPVVRERGTVVGHFGTYGDQIAPMLRNAVQELLRLRPDARVELLGTGGDAFAASLTDPRVSGPSRRPPAELSARLRACDVMLQPYPDGASGRRTTLMAALVNGVPVVTTVGRFSEPVWRDGAVLAVPPGELAAAVAALLSDPVRRLALAHRGLALYRSTFAAEHTAARLLA